MCYSSMEKCKKHVNILMQLKVQALVMEATKMWDCFYPLGSGEGCVGLNPLFTSVILITHVP